MLGYLAERSTDPSSTSRRISTHRTAGHRGLHRDRLPDVGALLASHGATDAWPHHSIADARTVEQVHAAGGRVIVWTVNHRRDVELVTALGVDGICTDDVTLLADG